MCDTAVAFTRCYQYPSLSILPRSSRGLRGVHSASPLCGFAKSGQTIKMSDSDSDSGIKKRRKVPAKNDSELYLDTVDRKCLDFDFEKVVIDPTGLNLSFSLASYYFHYHFISSQSNLRFVLSVFNPLMCTPASCADCSFKAEASQQMLSKSNILISSFHSLEKGHHVRSR